MPRNCPRCKLANKDDAIFCLCCGQELVQDETVVMAILDNRYEVTDLLGRGARGAVFKALDTRTGEVKALKMIPAYWDTFEEEKYGRKRFKEEAEFLARIKHDRLPPITGYFIDRDPETGKDAYYLVMKFIPGDNLEVIMEKSSTPLPYQEVLDYFRQITEILKYLHSINPPVLHLNIKPRNIIVEKDTLDYLLSQDFKDSGKGRWGKVYLVDSGTSLNFISNRFYSDSDYLEEDYPRREKDFYDLGKTLYTLLTGEEPQEPPEPLNQKVLNIPEYINDIILAMLEKDPSYRPSSADIILKMLDEGKAELLQNRKEAHKQAETKEEMVVDPHGKTPLHTACQEGDITKAEFLLTTGADINARDGILRTPLHYAAFRGHTLLVELLVNRGADIIARDQQGITPLELADSMGHEETADLLFCFIEEQTGTDIFATDIYGRTSLHRTSEEGNVRKAELLLFAQADVHARDDEGSTPIFRAILSEQKEIVEMLIQRGAKVQDRNYSGKSPLHIACQTGNPEIVNLLIEKGADVKYKTRDGWTPLHSAANRQVAQILIEKGVDVNVQARNGWTPLHGAISMDLARFLIEKGADVNIQTTAGSVYFAKGTTPLHNMAGWGHLDIIQLLIEKGADPFIRDENGNTPVDIAEGEGQGEIASFIINYILNQFQSALEREDRQKILWFIDNGFNINTPDDKGFTPLHRTILNDNITAFHLLLELGADLNAKSPEGWTPLHLSSGKGNTEMTAVLTEKGADISIPDDIGETPLFKSADFGFTETVRLLLNKKADINLKNSDGNTPLHKAVIKGHKEIVRLLAEKGADLNAKDHQGYTPLHKAVMKADREIVQLLLEKGADYQEKDPQGKTPLDIAQQLEKENKEEIAEFLRLFIRKKTSFWNRLFRI